MLIITWSLSFEISPKNVKVKIMQIAILLLIGVIMLIGWAVSSIQDGLENSRRKKERLGKLKEKWGDRQVDSSKNLEERNEDIIQKHLKQVRGGYQRPYYVENSVRDCIQEIAEAENNLDAAPNYEYLSNWTQRAIPEYLELKESLLKRFHKKQEEVEVREEKKEKEAIANKLDKLKEKYSNLITQFYEITERKVSLLDDYGDENWEALPKEIDSLIYKIAKQQGFNERDLKDWKRYDFNTPDEYKQLIEFLNKSFRKYHQTEKSKPLNGIDYTKMSGIEFEVYLSKLLSENGFTDIKGTPATGDQGADLIAKRNGKTIIVQAKRYDGAVGNKAVQEVASAVGFYGADEGWVITNSFFTKSAKELAQRLNVKLVDGRDLVRFSELYKNVE